MAKRSNTQYNRNQQSQTVRSITPQVSKRTMRATGTAGQYSRDGSGYTTRGSSRGQVTKGRSPQGKAPKEKGSGGKGFAIAAIIIALVLIGMIVALSLFIFKETKKAEINSDLHHWSVEEMEAIDSALTGNTSFDEPFTILLLGSDARDDDPDMGARTDTIILARVDPLTNTISMVSIPRDTMVTIPNVGTAKINAAYYWGGASGTIEVVKNLTGVEIDHYAEINFEGLVDLIDAIGGVDVYVESEIDDYDAGGWIPQGEQHLNGEEALIFARSRMYYDGDFSRQAHQRQLILAIVKRGLEAPMSDLAGLINTSTKFLSTDSGIDFDFIFSLAEQIRRNNDYPLTIYSANIPAGTAMVDEISYVVADYNGLAEMMRLFENGEDVSEAYGYNPSSVELMAESDDDEEYYEEEYYEEEYYEEEDE